MEKTILLVDDEEKLRKGLERNLEDLETYNFLGASNGEEALKIVSKEKIDLIVTDLLMPDMGGLEFMQKLSEWNFDIPIIAMSGGDRDAQYLDAGSLLENAKRYGAVDLIEKPFSIDSLVEKIEELFKGK